MMKKIMIILIFLCLSASAYADDKLLGNSTEATSQKRVNNDGDSQKDAETESIAIHFENVDITQFIKYISTLTNKNFILDSSVKGKVNIICPKQITVDEAYKLFESVLEVHGFTTVPAGSVIKIVPATDARSKNIDTYDSYHIPSSAED